MIEEALRYEITRNIPEFEGEIYPTNAPENHRSPHLVYFRTRTERIKTFDGYTGSRAISYMWSIMTARYADMISLRDRAEEMLLSFPKAFIGESAVVFVDDISVNDIAETYEYELKLYRGIIDFTIYI